MKDINPANAAKDQALAALPAVAALYYIINQFASNQMIVPCIVGKLYLKHFLSLKGCVTLLLYVICHNIASIFWAKYV